MTETSKENEMGEKYEGNVRLVRVAPSGGYGYGRIALETDEHLVWIAADGYPATARRGHVGDRHPLVVIDPEDDAEVERFREIASRWADRVPYDDSRDPGDLTHHSAMQGAFREYAEPKPPEPTGLGAVIEVDSSAAGVGRKRLVRTHNTVEPWYGDGVARKWEQIPASFNIEVLSEGVQS